MSRRASHQESRKIFTFTEVNSPKQDNKKLPVVTPLKLHSSSPEVSELKTGTSRTWKDFLESILYIGNHQTPRPHTVRNTEIQMYISGAVSERLGSPNSRRIVRTQNKPPGIYCRNVERKMLKVKKEYNETQERVIKQEKFVREIQSKLDELKISSQTDAKVSWRDRVMQSEYSEITKGFHNECFSQEVLLDMIQSRRNDTKILQKPINEIKRQLKDVTVELKETNLLHGKYNNELKKCKCLLEDLKQHRKDEDLVKNNELHIQLLGHLNSSASLQVIEKERLLNNNQVRCKNNIGLMQALAPMIKALEQEETSLQEMKMYDLQYETISKRIKELKCATNISSMREIQNYYIHLKDNEEQLRKELADAMSRERILKEEILRLHEDREKSFMPSTSFQEDISWNDQQSLKKVLSDRKKDAIEIDFMLHELDTIVIAACSSISVIYTQLHGNKSRLDCLPRKLLKYLYKCCDRIRRIKAMNTNDENGLSERILY